MIYQTLPQFNIGFHLFLLMRFLVKIPDWMVYVKLTMFRNWAWILHLDKEKGDGETDPNTTVNETLKESSSSGNSLLNTNTSVLKEKVAGQNSSEAENTKLTNIKPNEDDELLQMRRALLEETVSKKIPKYSSSSTSTKKRKNPPVTVIDLTKDFDSIVRKQTPVVQISDTPDIVVPGEVIE